MLNTIKKIIPNGVKKRLKHFVGIPEDVPIGKSRLPRKSNIISDAYIHRRKEFGSITRIAFFAGGGLGDYIIYLPILDKLMATGACLIDFYTDNNVEFPRKIYDKHPNLSVFSTYFSGFQNEQYDLVLDSDHYTTRRYCDSYKHISQNMPELDRYMFQIEKFNHTYRSDSTRQPWRNVVTLKHAKFSGLNRWTYLSLGSDVFDMREQYASIIVDESRYSSTLIQGLMYNDYIVVSRGADPISGGEKQTKIWPKEKYEEFIYLFKNKYPVIKVIQIAINEELGLDGVDEVIRNADLSDVELILKQALIFIGSEGGMVHLASQMSTKCVVVFGPTPVYYYGYNRNKNIVSPHCSDCMGAIEEWYTVCLYNHERAECMWNITATMVLNAVTEIFEDYKYCYFENDNAPIQLDSLVVESSVIGFIGKEFSDEAVSVAKFSQNTFILSSDFFGEYLGDENDVNIFVNGYDLSHNLNMKFLNSNGVKTIIGTCFNIPKDDEYFDLLVIDSRVKDNEYAMKELLRVLKLEGRLLLYDNKKIVASMLKMTN